jgi:hypothetical protein
VPPTYRERLRIEGYTLAACGALDCALLLALHDESRRKPLNTLAQLAVVGAALAWLGPRAARRAIEESHELEPGEEGTGEPTPLWQLPAIVATLTLSFGLMRYSEDAAARGAGWDAALRIGGGCLLVGLAQAILLERTVAKAEHLTGRHYIRAAGSRLGRGTRLGWRPR